MSQSFIDRPRWFVAPATAVLAVFVMACGLVSPGASTSAPVTSVPATAVKAPKVTQQAADSNAPTKEASSSSPSATSGTAYFGDTLEQDGCSLSVSEIADPAVVNRDYKVKSGKRIVAVHFQLGNTARAKLTVQPLNSALLDDAGNAYPPEFVALDNEIPVIELQAGEHADGWMGYSVPERAKITGYRYAPDLTTGSEKSVTVNLQPAPAGHTPLKAATQRVAPALPAMGSKVEVDGYSLMAAGLADPAKPGILYRPTEGTRLVSVDIAVSNVSSTDKLFVNPMYFVLVDSTGAIYTSELGGVSDQIEAVDLTAGQIQTGKVAFVVPSNVKLESVRMAPFLRLDFVLQSGLK